jgi:hypothetical protein
LTFGINVSAGEVAEARTTIAVGEGDNRTESGDDDQHRYGQDDRQNIDGGPNAHASLVSDKPKTKVYRDLNHPVCDLRDNPTGSLRIILFS